ncbi:hypothetical protein DTO164E3_5001 [Paecilomyces variotii]|nr:hypothetical protein DTO164E3_5001 [Paecilomyces variotii]KAJ9201225.1 hypothetical protein DTO032I3_4286 [Paecilomyces variotii]KAJ9242111.1 hypothetical protein DTO169E5_3332 [Paecilomyces variotii]KAJ9260066.1 hypothetical protein DTO207G8_763 [Paecilomyces variotii]KAJ9277033.1 hypothetical protein DTO021D3_6131 [Paecilomyces variotii]
MMDELDNVFDDHPSLDASLEDFEANSNNVHRTPLFGLPSQHSGFRAEESDGDATSTAGEPWSPPGFRRHDYVPGSGWYRHQPYSRKEDNDRLELKPPVRDSPSQSREPSPQYEDAQEGPTSPGKDAAQVGELGDISIPANVPLPKGTDSPLKGRSPSPTPAPRGGNDGDGVEFGAENLSNYIRFAVRAEVQHREPFVALFNYARSKFDSMTSSKSTTTLSVIVALLSIAFMRALFLPPVPQAVPDLVKLSGLARSFEPLIYYSENGVQQIGTLQETGVAVWDLGESVRGTNMTSAPLIVRELDELSESLKTLSLELTRFFANVDSDIDSILIVMDWAKRELESLSSQPPSAIPSIVYDNLHTMLSRLGALERISATVGDAEPSDLSTTTPTMLGHIVMAVFGPTSAQRTRATLTRTFTEFLSVLEESINSELTHSTALFALFEAIDRQFLNLQRTVVRESDAQERAEGEMLSSLWTRVLGPDAAMVRKYEKNKRLLASVRSRTVANKHLLMDHRGRLLTLKVGLETLRRKLVSPLVRRNDSVSFMGIDGANSRNAGRTLTPVEAVVEGQIRGLEGAYDYLRAVREKQKAKLMEMVYGSGRRVPGSSTLPTPEPEQEVIEER